MELVKLYCKLNEEKRVRLVDPRTKQVDYMKSYIIHPTIPTEVPKKDADALVLQDPHLVSTKPLPGGAKEKVKPAPPILDPEEPGDRELAIKKATDLLDRVNVIKSKPLEDVSVKELNELCEEFNLSRSASIKKVDKLNNISDSAERLAAGLV